MKIIEKLIAQAQEKGAPAVYNRGGVEAYKVTIRETSYGSKIMALFTGGYEAVEVEYNDEGKTLIYYLDSTTIAFGTRFEIAAMVTALNHHGYHAYKEGHSMRIKKKGRAAFTFGVDESDY